MNETYDPGDITADAALLESEELGALKAAEAHAQALRQEAIGRAQAHLRALMRVLNVSGEELLGLPPRKRRSRKNAEAETE